MKPIQQQIELSIKKSCKENLLHNKTKYNKNRAEIAQTPPQVKVYEEIIKDPSEIQRTTNS
jgi:hypothetical protein